MLFFFVLGVFFLCISLKQQIRQGIHCCTQLGTQKAFRREMGLSEEHKQLLSCGLCFPLPIFSHEYEEFPPSNNTEDLSGKESIYNKKNQNSNRMENRTKKKKGTQMSLTCRWPSIHNRVEVLNSNSKLRQEAAIPMEQLASQRRKYNFLTAKPCNSPFCRL